MIEVMIDSRVISIALSRKMQEEGRIGMKIKTSNIHNQGIESRLLIVIQGLMQAVLIEFAVLIKILIDWMLPPDIQSWSALNRSQENPTAWHVLLLWCVAKED